MRLLPQAGQRRRLHAMDAGMVTGSAPVQLLQHTTAPASGLPTRLGSALPVCCCHCHALGAGISPPIRLALCVLAAACSPVLAALLAALPCLALPCHGAAASPLLPAFCHRPVATTRGRRAGHAAPALTACELPPLAPPPTQVYECAADVCARAGDLGEALKALQMLVHHIYPALAAAAAGAAGASAAVGEPGGAPGLQRQPQQCRAEPAAGGRPWRQGGGGRHGEDEEDEDAWLAGPSTQLDEAAVAAALQQTAFRRWPEAAGALVLYFTAARPVGAPSGDAQLDTLATLRRLPPQLLRSDPVRAALRLRAALAAGDYVTLFRLRQGAPPPLVRSLLSGSVTAAARERALAVMAAAYRNISVAAVCRMLALGTPRLLHACLKLMADRWVLTARGASGIESATCRSGNCCGMCITNWLSYALFLLLVCLQGSRCFGPCAQWAAAGRGSCAGSGRLGVQRMRSVPLFAMILQLSLS